MAKMTFSKRGRRVQTSVTRDRAPSGKSVQDVVREMKEGMKKPPGEDYRERSLAIHGLICGRCGREFGPADRHLLTVHHKDGNHSNNPPDGSNWENLCVYCHEDIHSREVLGEYYDGTKGRQKNSLVFSGDQETTSETTALGTLGEKLQKALNKKK